MIRGFVTFLALLLLVPEAFAHRLNEYLEAATISLLPGKILMELRLTPGRDVAANVQRKIDLNGDHHISPEEQRTYLATLDHDLLITLDGRTIALTSISFSFPTVEAMNNGVGDILITYGINTGNEDLLHHQLVLKNGHYSSIAVYLVNCLLPADTGIHVTGQIRSNDQSVYQLDFTTGNTQPAALANQQRSVDHANDKAVIKTYFLHGIRHILSGYDHLLFLCALILGAVSLWDLIKIVTAFTIAHSITLTLATLGLAHLPEQVVEPVITASIVFVAVQNIVWPKQGNGYHRLAVAFFFGLFHGLGFAGGLLELMHAMQASLALSAIVVLV